MFNRVGSKEAVASKAEGASNAGLLKAQILVVIPLLERKCMDTPSKFYNLMLQRYRRDLQMLNTVSDKPKMHYGLFNIRGGYESYRISNVARDEALECEIQHTETILHQLMTAGVGCTSTVIYGI